MKYDVFRSIYNTVFGSYLSAIAIFPKNSPVFPPVDLIYPLVYTCFLLDSVHAGKESGEPLPMQVWESKLSPSSLDLDWFHQMLSGWSWVSQLVVAVRFLVFEIIIFFFDSNRQVVDAKIESEIRWRKSFSLIRMVNDLNSDDKGSNHEDVLGWREGFVLSGSMCFEKIIIF